MALPGHTRVIHAVHQMSHRLFALGLSAAVAFFLDVSLIALPLMLVLSYFIGSIPDMDIKLGLKHRGFTHHLLFFVAMMFACSIGVFYFYYLLELLVGFPLFELKVEFFSGFPIPAFFVLAIQLEFVAIIDDVFFQMIVFFFVAFMSHFILDMITPSGVEIGSTKISGSIKSDNSFFNAFFAAIGLVTFLVSIGFMVVKAFTDIDVNWSTWYFITTGGLVALVMIVSIARRSRNPGNKLRCYKLDNNINVCLPPGKCFQIGIDKDDKICNIDEGSL